MKITPLMIGVGGIAAYFLFLKPPPVSPLTANAAPGIVPPGSTLPVDPTTGAVPTTYGINGGYAAGKSYASVANYAQIRAANPEAVNPNHQLTPAEANQYFANYQDLRTGIATWPGGTSQANAQKHWTLYGAVTDQRIYIPLTPPSTAAYIAPPVVATAAPAKGSSSWVSSALSVAGSVAVALLGTDDQSNQLTQADKRVLFTSAGIIKDITPFFRPVNKPMVDAINAKLDYELKRNS